MISNDYIPCPAKINGIELSDTIKKLSESLAKNVHEVWAQSRIDEGWTYGPVRNDELKQTPCLVPYEDLPEIEKAYDRNTALSTLEFIVSLGYDIVEKER